MLQKKTIFIAILIVFIVLAPTLWLMLDQPLPQGTQGPQAHKLATDLAVTIGCDAWQQLGAVAWLFKGERSHLWDRKRHLLRTQEGKHTVFLDLNTRRGWCFKGERRLDDQKAQPHLDKAWSSFINDAFWLNPFCSMMANDVEKALVVDEHGQDALLVTYPTGGVTPGDSYLITLGPDGLPNAWRMWVSIIPMGGVRATWEGWEPQNGIQFSSTHKLGPLTLDLDIRSAPNLALLVEDDPFDAFAQAMNP